MAEKIKIPEIRFKGFSEEWEERILGELGSVQMNRRIFKDQTLDEGDVPFFKIGTFGRKPDAYITKALFEEYKSKYPYPEKGDLLISASGSIGKIIEYKGKNEYFQDSNIVWLQHDNRLTNSFLKQFYSFVKWSGLEGSTIKRLYNKNILETPISLPKPEEQSQIGTLFSHLDHLITLRQQKYNKLVTIKKAMLEKMFPQNGVCVPEIRFKGFTEKWEERKLGEVADIVGGGTPDTNNPEYWGGSIDWYSPTEIGKEIYAKGSVKKITSLGLKKSSAKILPADRTILFTSRAGIGDMAILKRPGATNQGFQSFVLMDDYDPYFMFSVGHLIKRYALKYSSGSTFLEISGKTLEKIEIHIPKLIEQEKVGAFFKNLDNLITLQKSELEKLKNIKKACLEKMFV